MEVKEKFSDKFDISLFTATVLLVIIGLVAIYSSTVNHPTASGNFERQFFWFIISLVACFIVYFIPFSFIKTFAIPFYLVTMFFEVVLILVGRTVYGAKSWLIFGPIGFQPSEIAKIGTILMLAYWLSDKSRDINKPKDILITLVIGFIPIGLILLEPDLGTAIVFGVLTLSMLFWRGISLFKFFIVISPAVVAFSSLLGSTYIVVSIVLIIAALFFFRKNLFTSASVVVFNLAAAFVFDYSLGLLKPHQQKRILSFVDPSTDPLGSGYNVLQAKVAIGSGGLLGKGFLEGSQTQLRFIPEQWTDFIFCVIGEEFGFLGSFIVLSLFMIVFLRLLNITSSAKDNFGFLLSVGIFTLLFTHFALNIGMNLGITPVIGLPLPFLSYGGSSLLVNMVLLGLALKVYRIRK